MSVFNTFTTLTVGVERRRGEGCSYICLHIKAIIPLCSLRFLPLHFTLSAFYVMFVPLHSVVHCGFAFCDPSPFHDVTSRAYRFRWFSRSVGSHFVCTAIRLQSRVYILSTTDTLSCLHDVQANSRPIEPTTQLVPEDLCILCCSMYYCVVCILCCCMYIVFFYVYCVLCILLFYVLLCC
jgi:hypothetical protein